MSADTSGEPSEGHDFLVGNDVLKVGHGTVDGHLLDGLSCLASVLQTRDDKN